MLSTSTQPYDAYVMDPQALGPGICRPCWKNYQGSSKPFTRVLDSVITVTNDLEMEEYRARVRPTPPPSRKPTTTGFNLGDLASQYKLEDMMVTPDEPPVGDTVEKE